MIFFGRFLYVGVAGMPLAQAQAPAARKLAIANKPATKSAAKARGPTNRDQLEGASGSRPHHRMHHHTHPSG